MTATGDKIVVGKNRAGVYGCYKMDLNPNQMKDEYIIYLEEKPIGALVKRTDNEYFLLIPSCFLKGTIFALSGEPNREILRRYADWNGITNTASYCFAITYGVKAIWKIAIDMEIADGIRDRFTPEMAEAELKRLLGNSGEYSYATLPQRITELQDNECVLVRVNDGGYLVMDDAELNQRLAHTLTVQNFLPPKGHISCPRL